MNLIITLIEEVQAFALLSARASTNLFRRPRYVKDTFQQMDEIGVKSVAIIILTGFFTGGVLALQSASSLKAFGAVNLTGQLVALSLVKELGPVLAALMVAGRVGSGIASPLGSMVVTEQIDAMRELDRVRERLQRAQDDLQNIVVRMEIQTEYRGWIRSDSYISLGSVGLLGDKYIQISLGRAPDPPKTVVDTIDGGWWGDVEVEFVEVTGRPQTDFEELITGANDILVNFRTLSEKVQDVVSRFESGEGTVGKFLTDPSFSNNLNETVIAARGTVEDASILMENINQGEGTIPRLIHQQELYDRILDSAARLDRVLSDVEAGEGTVGKLLKDPELYDHAQEAMASIQSVAVRLDAGEGTLGRLSTDDELYREMNNALQKLTGFVNDIEAGKGTLGRLAKDEQLYENVNEFSAEVVKMIYYFRQNPKKFLTIKFELF